MIDRYILDGMKAVPCGDLIAWEKWFQTADRTVRQSTIQDVRVSTVFLGIDHSFAEGAPLLFETMIFGGAHDEFQERYETWDQAVEGHERACVLAASPADDAAVA